MVLKYIKKLFGYNTPNIGVEKSSVYHFLSNFVREYAGEYVSESSVLQIPEVSACVQNLAADLSDASFPTYKRSNNGRIYQREHKVHQCLNYVPNPNQTAQAFRYAMTASYLLQRNAFAQIIDKGSKYELYKINNELVTQDLKNGWIEYKIKGSDNNLQQNQILHIVGYSNGTGYTGESLLETGLSTFGLILAIDHYLKNLFENGLLISGYFKNTAGTSASQRKEFLESLKEGFGGAKNSHVPPIVPPGYEFAPFQSINPENAQLMELRKQLAVQVCSLFRVSPTDIGILDKSSYNTLEQNDISYTKKSLRFHAIAWEQEVNRKLYTELEKKQGYYSEMELASLLRGDMSALANWISTTRNWGVHNGNELREMLNLPNYDGGEIYLLPANMTNATNYKTAPAPQQPKQTQSIEAPEQTATFNKEPLLKDVANRIATKINKAMRTPDTDYLTTYCKDKQQLFTNTLTPVFVSLNKDALTVDDVIENINTKIINNLSDAITFDSVDMWREQLEEIIYKELNEQ